MSVTTKAVSAISVYGLGQITLWSYSLSHPKIESLLNLSFLFGMVFYAAVFDYHAKRVKTFKERVDDARVDSN